MYKLQFSFLKPNTCIYDEHISVGIHCCGIERDIFYIFMFIMYLTTLYKFHDLTRKFDILTGCHPQWIELNTRCIRRQMLQQYNKCRILTILYDFVYFH